MTTPILTPIEALVLQDSAFFLTKAAIDAKISDLFVALKHKIEATLESRKSSLDADWVTQPGRTYRGENLGHLPWRALDCPRHFDGTDMCTFRTLLLWGRGFSFHMLLSGPSLRRHAAALVRAHATLATAGWQLSMQASPWDWEMQPEAYRPLSAWSPTAFAQEIDSKPWIKLSIALPLSAFDEVPAHGSALFTSIMDAFFTDNQPNSSN